MTTENLTWFLAGVAITCALGLGFISLHLWRRRRERHRHLALFHSVENYANVDIVVGVCTECGRDIKVRIPPIYSSSEERKAEMTSLSLKAKGWTEEPNENDPTRFYMREAA